MECPLVSVIIPAYNAERTIRATLHSVLGQTITDLELIVVDDGSTDGTARVAGSVDDPRVRLIRQENAGHASARNSGIAEASGIYVAVVDADDLWFADKLERQLEVLRSQPHVRALHSSAVHVNDSLEPLFIGRCAAGRSNLLDVLCFRGLPGFMCTLIVQRELLNQLGGFDASLIILQDWELAIRLARQGDLYGMSEPLVLYRVHAGNQSKQLELHIEPGERILSEFFADPDLAPAIAERRRYVYAHFYAMLCGGAFQLRRGASALYWARRALTEDPRVIGHLAALPLRRLSKRLSRQRALGLYSSRLVPGEPRPT